MGELVLGAPVDSYNPAAAAIQPLEATAPTAQLPQVPAESVASAQIQNEEAEVRLQHPLTTSVSHEPAPSSTTATRDAQTIDPTVSNPAHTSEANTATTLPLGSAIHPIEQAEKVQNAPHHIIEKEVKKKRDAEQKLMGEEVDGNIVDGLEDDQVCTMLRRFNYQINQVLSPPRSLPPGQPDLRPSTLPDVPFNSDGLKSNAERVYSTAGVTGIVFAREMMRLMSWSAEERKRTGTFCAAYFTAWYYSLTIPLIVALLMLLVIYPSSRLYLFPSVIPPAGQPISATDPTQKKGDESMLSGVEHPITHRSKSEQIEEQSKEFMNFIERFGVKAIVGGVNSGGRQGNAGVGGKNTHESSEEESSDDEDIRQSSRVKPVSDEVDGNEAELSEKDKKKLSVKLATEKRDKMVGDMAKMSQDALGDLADFLERCHHALTPHPTYYPRTFFRIKVVGLILFPIFVLFAVVPAHIWAQGASFGAGVGFFGQPLIKWGIRTFVTLVPNWMELMDLRNSIFSGVPTNAQVVLLILRSYEQAHNPLPPPPDSPTSKHMKIQLSMSALDPEAEEAENIDGAGGQSGAKGELEGEDGHNQELATNEHGEEQSMTDKVVKKSRGKILGGLRTVAKKVATFGADVREADDGTEGKREKVGNKIDRLFYQSRAKDDGTPESYPAKLNGTSGHLLLHSAPTTTPTLSFISLRSTSLKFKAPVSSLVELKKEGVWIGRAVLGWAAAIKLEGMGLELRFQKGHLVALGENQEDKIVVGEGAEGTKRDGEDGGEEGKWRFSHVGRRDQLFNRLIAVGGQKWETL